MSQPIVAALVALPLLGGCFAVAQVTGLGATVTDINVADGRGDEKYIRDVCAGKRLAKDKESKDYACFFAEKYDKPKKALEADCGSIMAAYDDSPKDELSFVIQMSKKIADCGLYAELFEQVVHYGNHNEGVKILDSLASSGYPVKDEWSKYLSSHQGSQFFPAEEEAYIKYGLSHIGAWLVQGGHKDLCASTARAAAGASEAAQVWVMPYFTDATCKEGIPLMVGLLGSSNPTHRKWSCQALAKIGDKSSGAKVKILAETDAHVVEREEVRGNNVYLVKEYPVRDACQQAYGQIQLRY